jgi:hypothetical protein
MQRVWIGLAWLAFALFNAAKVVAEMRSEGMHHNWTLLFTIEALSWLPWALATVKSQSRCKFDSAYQGGYAAFVPSFLVDCSAFHSS